MPTKEQLEQARDEGLTQGEAARRFGCNPMTIRRHSKKNGVVWPWRHGFTPKHYAWIDGEWLSMRQIADRAGIPHRTVCWRRRHGWRDEDLGLPTRHDTRPPEYYETDHDSRDWQEIVGLARERGIKHAAAIFHVPYGAVGAALRGEHERLG